ncbi:hypothetical protein F4780DRAFT_779187 [Xylariomycetidae sp. FL0641]|nr:hypothetical protein F4780DRAFT_779187 [Xylariomycetidae sp. FL0641]
MSMVRLHSNDIYRFDDGTFVYESQVVVCVVCGVYCEPVSLMQESQPTWLRPTLIKGTPAFPAWSRRADSGTAYRQNHRHLLEVHEVHAYAGGAGTFAVPDPTHGLRRAVVAPRDPTTWLPVHRKCFDLAESWCADASRFKTQFRAPPVGKPSSIAHLYEVWAKRAVAQHPYPGPMQRAVREPSGYGGVPALGGLTLAAGGFARAILEADPESPVPGDLLAEAVLACRLPATTSTGTDASLPQRLGALPPELRDAVADMLVSGIRFAGEPAPAPAPTRALPGAWWRARLFAGALVPWLGGGRLREADLRAAVVEGRGGVYDPEAVDWERIVRALCQPDVFVPGRGLLGRLAVPALRNRHRIWMLLDRTRLGPFYF